MTPYHQIVELVTLLRQGRASAEVVDHQLGDLEASLALWDNQIRLLDFPAQAAIEASTLQEDSLQALDLFAQSIARVRQYMIDGDEPTADLALEEALEAVEIILRVKGTTEDGIDRILEEG